MKSYQSEVLIEKSPDAVFPYLLEREKQALWSDVPMRPVTEGPLAAGSRFEVTFGMGPLKATLGLEMTAVEQSRRMAWKTYSGPIDWTGEYVLEPDGAAGTKLSQRGTLKFGGVWRLMEPVVGGEISEGEKKELEKLKAVVEAS